jgi:hypothetical protein
VITPEAYRTMGRHLELHDADTTLHSFQQDTRSLDEQYHKNDSLSSRGAFKAFSVLVRIVH